MLHGIRSVLPGMVARRSGTIINLSSIGDRVPGPDGEVYHASKAAVRSLATSLQKSQAANNIRVINVAPGLVRTSIHADMGISFAEYCQLLGNPDFISADELAEIIMHCWRLPQRICIRDIVVMPTSSIFGSRSKKLLPVLSRTHRRGRDGTRKSFLLLFQKEALPALLTRLRLIQRPQKRLEILSLAEIAVNASKPHICHFIHILQRIHHQPANHRCGDFRVARSL